MIDVNLTLVATAIYLELPIYSVINSEILSSSYSKCH